MKTFPRVDPRRRAVLRSLVGDPLCSGLVSRLMADEGSSSSLRIPLLPVLTFRSPGEAGDLPLHERRVSHVDSWDPKPRLF